MNERETLKINESGHIEIGGFDALDLKERYGTPLYVLDMNYVEKIMEVFSKTISEEYGNGHVVYASKALSTTAICAFLAARGYGVDVVSGGELFTAIKGGVDPAKIYFHGNNKLDYEIVLAIKTKVRAIVVDNLDEIEDIDKLAKKHGEVQGVLIRLNPGINAHTHEFVQTATVDSKFGISISSGDAIKAVKKILECKNLKLLGIHTHIGSQIFEYDAFVQAGKIMTDFMSTVKNTFNFEFDELNMGGGFGIYYEGEDKKFTLETYSNHVKAMIIGVRSELHKKGLSLPFLTIEPGRSIVGEAGITLYTVGAIKDIPNIRKYVSVDGGMFDNPRFALYDSRYSACIANRASEKAEELVTVVGKCCESGDVIAKDVLLQSPKKGDTVCVFSTGAYNYSMASNYNRNLVPPVVAVYGDYADYIVKPQSFSDLTRNDVVPIFIKK